MNPKNLLSAQHALFLIKPCYYNLDIVSTCLTFQVNNCTPQIKGRMRRRMSGKKSIKIQSASDEGKEKDIDAEIAATDRKDPQGKPEKADPMQVVDRAPKLDRFLTEMSPFFTVNITSVHPGTPWYT